MTGMEEVQDLWLFGYGSLIWKPPPHYDLRLPGYIEGYVRRFWQLSVSQQASEDHRGTPEAPGRVCTLIDRKLWETLSDEHPTAPPRVWGAAYRIPAAKVPEVTEYMNIREINGYSIQYTPFKRPEDMSATYQDVHIPEHLTATDANSKAIKCLVYIGLPDNPQFQGFIPQQELAEHIVKSRGPSGENKDYLYELEKALDALSEESGDEHITDLARRCRSIEARQ
ncbi:Putative glutathione-specific gamma-glutamylcyclotransferase, gamma-glutamyl cyclotransferase [Septoria linicola]|uniref:glutathione-specific gamma-glutamylcyclotransferase n=1 Tax=Septoria linicola TaxID=215465 RepID=A0A9Q9B0X6_9PEZI|nr:Putative glutathione-specific gamma-glutamylcyclotransferase, gamma-glutamyl cyclotransferase [Septoria linicola]